MRAGQAGDPGPTIAIFNALPQRPAPRGEGRPPARAIVPKRARSERWSPAASVAATSTRSPASVTTAGSTPSVTAAGGARGDATSRAPSLVDDVDGRPFGVRPSQLVPTRPGAASRPAPGGAPEGEGDRQLWIDDIRSPLLAALAVRSVYEWPAPQPPAAVWRGGPLPRAACVLRSLMVDVRGRLHPRGAAGHERSRGTSLEEARRVGDEIGVDWDSFDLSSGSGLTSSRATVAIPRRTDRVAMVAAARQACTNTKLYDRWNRSRAAPPRAPPTADIDARRR